MTALRVSLPDDLPEDDEPMLPDDKQTVPAGPETAYSAAVSATWANPDTRAKRIASTKAALSRPEVRQRVAEGAKRRSSLPCVRKVLSDRQRARMADPELRKRVGAAMREIWAKRKAEGFTLKRSSKVWPAPARDWMAAATEGERVWFRKMRAAGIGSADARAAIEKARGVRA